MHQVGDHIEFFASSARGKIRTGVIITCDAWRKSYAVLMDEQYRGLGHGCGDSMTFMDRGWRVAESWIIRKIEKNEKLIDISNEDLESVLNG